MLASIGPISSQHWMPDGADRVIHPGLKIHSVPVWVRPGDNSVQSVPPQDGVSSPPDGSLSVIVACHLVAASDILRVVIYSVKWFFSEEKKLSFMANILDISTKRRPLCSPSTLPSNEFTFISLAPLLADFAHLDMLFIPLLIHCHQCASLKQKIT